MNQYYQQTDFSSQGISSEPKQPRRRAKRRVKVQGGPKPPKRPVNGYILYSVERRTQLKAEHSSKHLYPHRSSYARSSQNHW